MAAGLDLGTFLGTTAAGLAILGTIGGSVRLLWVRYRDNRPPRVSIATNVSLDRNVFPTDRYNTSWGRTTSARYTVVEIKNVRGKPITLAGVFAQFPDRNFINCLVATNALRELQPSERTFAYFEVDKYGAPVPDSITVRWIVGEHTYNNYPQAKGWMVPQSKDQ